MSTKDLGITVKKADDLSEWYTQVVTKAQLADYSSAKGFMVLMPYGFSIWESIKEHFDRKIKEIGHRNAYFPLLIPERLLKREAEHFEGFTPEVFWVTHSGNNELGERLAIRPTSETIINESYSRWVKSWRDLPVLINVWNSALRAESTSTKPFEIKFLGKDEKEHFAWTTSWGISWRLIGAMIMAHGDDKGLVLPPRIAPIQVVFVPIHYKESDKETILQTAHHIADGLGKHSIRTFIDDREQYTPGWKYHEWEMKGVPLRVEIGPKDMQSQQITVVRRDTAKN